MGNILKGEVIYNKFLREMIEIKVRGCIIEKISYGCATFLRHLKEELQHTTNPCVKDDIKMMTKIIEELRKSKSTDNKEFSISLTISEFLLFNYAIESVVGVVETFRLSDPLGIEFVDFMIYLNERYSNIMENEVKVYYEFLATYDTLKERVLN